MSEDGKICICIITKVYFVIIVNDPKKGMVAYYLLMEVFLTQIHFSVLSPQDKKQQLFTKEDLYVFKIREIL